MPTGLIEIQDEVNVRILGIPQGLMATAQANLTYYVPGYHQMPKYRMGWWNGQISLLSTTGKTYLNLVDSILPVFENAGYDFVIEDHRHDWSTVANQIELPTDQLFADHSWPDGNPIVLRDYQMKAITKALEAGSGLLELATGAGKAQPLNSKIMTPAGYTCMGDIAVGDTISTIDGKTTTVTGVYPQGIKPVYEMEFQDGRIVRCCDEHLWYVYDKRLGRNRGKSGLDRFEVIPAKTIKRIMDGTVASGNQLQIPLTPTYHDAADLPVDPYVLGALIGDGGLSITHSVHFTTMDDDIIQRLMERTEDGDVWTKTKSKSSGLASQYVLSNPTRSKRVPNLRLALAELGLMGTKSETKFIPDIYLTASIEQRIELLRGLMDTDGCVDPNKGTTTYSTSSQTLANQFVELIRSLGGIAYWSTKDAWYRDVHGNRIAGLPHYRINFQMPDPSIIVLCERKKAAARKTQYSDGLTLRITAIREVGEEPVQCISVADPTRIYITDHYTVTHNTLVCAALSKVYSQFGKVVVIVPDVGLILQTQSLFKRVGLDVGIWYADVKDARQITISTWQSLDHYPELFAGVVCCIVDEAHQAKAKVLSEIMSGPAANVPFRFGCTGTVPKEDLYRNQIFGVIGPIIFSLMAWELQEAGVLASANVFQVALNDRAVPDYVRSTPFEDWGDYLTWIFSRKDRMQLIADIIIDTAETYGNTLILVPQRAHGKYLQSFIPGSISLDGKDKATFRQEQYQDFNEADNAIMICTSAIASTGLDIPRIKVLGFIEPGKKFEKIIQTVGRGLRKAHDKDHVTLLDIHGNADMAKKHAATRRKLYTEAKIAYHTEELIYHVDT